MLLFLFCLLTVLTKIQAARILGVFPMPSISHQVVFRPLTQELAKRGHELVIITPDPAFPKDRPKDNITEIDISNSYKVMISLLGTGKNLNKRGVVKDLDTMMSEKSQIDFFRLITETFNYKEVNDLIADKNQKFDLVIVEAIGSSTLIFSNIFDAPVIWMSSLYGFPENYEAVGAIARHPIYYPHLLRNRFQNLSFFDKLKEVYYEYKLAEGTWINDEKENTVLKSKFGPDVPTVSELKNNVDLLFLNSRPYFDNNRPVPPSVVYLGALHLQPVKPLPEDLKSYLDKSKRGVVYVSLGTNVRPAMMDKDLLDSFINAFKALPYDILWKFDGGSLNVPNNVKIQKWFPQRDLLVHPNIKAFVTQGGLQSTDEALDSAVPLVGIPMLADQWYNVNKYVEQGIGIQLDGLTLTADDLVKAVTTVIEDKSYKSNIERLRAIIKDEPQSPIERAVWWTEYVIRHGGAKHLRAPAANTTWTEYLMLDVVIFVIGVVAFTVLLAVSLVYYLVRLVLCSLNGKKKIKKS